ncbi:zinc ribbon domain-containing protein [Streptomyces sp. NPDC005790]|uniref:zinc ribbon domain-containing protein n=1 Tax=Streptomyces sp. NPDC005790 TaxID=3154777 RepID=UPI0033DFB13F
MRHSVRSGANCPTRPRRHGTRLIVADRWFPSSKTCSRCGAVKAKLPLSVRVFECDTCGLVLDRDANAGHNLVALATRTTRPCNQAGTGRAGGTIPSLRTGTETGDRQQDTRTQLVLW